MKKNIKRYLSYVLGVILAMGLGLSYAYAVGANDSNAFVTTTEWETKVAQFEATLDNVTKTINDTNMDFMLNGSRLQASLVDGLEDVGGILNTTGDIHTSQTWHHPTYNYYQNLYPRNNDTVILNLWDGRQVVRNVYWGGGGNYSYTCYNLKFRYAVRCTNDPNYYLVFNIYSGDYDGAYLWYVNYVQVGTYPISYNTARTLEVKLPIPEWYRYTGPITSLSNVDRNNNCSSGTPGETHDYLQSSNTAIDGWDAPGSNAYWSQQRNSTNTEVTYRFEFPANKYGIRICTGYTLVVPSNLQGRKFGSPFDRIAVPSSTNVCVAKVYSPIKGCLCLKSYLNGEIPIFNE